MALYRRRLRALVATLCVAAGACSYTTRDIAPAIPANAQSSRIFAADGSVLHVPDAEQDREEVRLGQIPRHVQDAVVAIEDERFWEHRGVDVRAVLRALRENTEQGEVEQGGSTITQQFVKTTILGDERTIKRKIQEAALAFQLERKYTKQRILELYLNTIYFGHGAYGVQAAAGEYFGKRVGDLTIGEAALLAGLIRAPVTNDPFVRPDLALVRRDVVLGKMGGLGLISPEQLAAAKAEPLTLTPPPAEARYPAAHFVEEVKQFVLDDPRFGATALERKNLLFNGGLRIHTTLDPALQAAAELSILAVLDHPDVDPDAALVSIDPKTGYVRAMVSNQDFFGPDAAAKVNFAVGKGRPTGSAFKPYVLAAALEAGIPLGEVLPAPGCIVLVIPNDTEPWDPCNADPGEGNPLGVDLVEGTVHSYNTLFAQLILQVGPEKAVETAAQMGIRTPLLAVPSAVLGANDVRVIDMASAYGTLANRGVYVPPVLVTRITRPDGTVLYEHHHDQIKAIDAKVADQVNWVLQQVIQRGTGTRAEIGRPAAGKTGTGQDYANGWFCGYTPELATAVWLGFHEGEIPMQPPNTRIRVYGGTWPAEIWQRFMSAALANVPPSGFVEPPPTTTTTLPPGVVPSTVAPALVVTPSVVGYSAATAAARLAGIGLDSVTTQVVRHDVPEGIVAAQSPSSGTAVPLGSTITLQVSTGGAPIGPSPTGPPGGGPPTTGAPRFAVVPNVVGLRLEDAVARVRGQGFETQVIIDHGGPRGRVFAQDPVGGASVQVGSLVTLWAYGND